MPEPDVRGLLAQSEGDFIRHPLRSLEWCRQAWAMVDAGTPVEVVLECQLALGRGCLAAFRTGEAMVWFCEALNQAQEHGLSKENAEARLGLAAVNRRLGRLAEALAQLDTVLKEVPELSAGQRMRVYVARGDLFLDLDDPQQAEAAAAQAEELLEHMGDSAWLPELCRSLSQVYRRLRRWVQAEKHGSAALLLARQNDDPIGQVEALLILGTILREQQDNDAAVQRYQEAHQLSQKAAHPRGQAEAALALGAFDEAAEIAQSIGAEALEAEAVQKRAEVFEQEGDFVQALAWAKRSWMIERRLRKNETRDNLDAVLDRFQADQVRSLNDRLRWRSETLEAESKQLKKALDSLRVISELGRRITSSLTVSGLFQTLYESLSQLFDLPAFGLALYDSGDRTIRFPLRIHEGKPIPPQGRRSIVGTFSGWAIEHRSTLLLTDIEHDAPQFLGPSEVVEPPKDLPFQSAIFLPLFVGTDPIGVITVQHPERGAYDEVHSRFLETLGGYIVVALRNALSHRKVRQLNRQILRLAQFDPLTGLANRRFLADYLRRTISMCQRRGRRFALFFLDLDGFKPVNDHWGHEAGDWVLSQLGDRLTGTLRDSDLVARVGGDEFVALAIEVDDRMSIEAIAEKLAGAINTPLVWQGEPIQLGASIGIAVFPEAATDAEGLMSKADAAMYRVKRRGKNGWAFAEDSPTDTNKN